jgi:hypothetical protein
MAVPARVRRTRGTRNEPHCILEEPDPPASGRDRRGVSNKAPLQNWRFGFVWGAHHCITGRFFPAGRLRDVRAHWRIAPPLQLAVASFGKRGATSGAPTPPASNSDELPKTGEDGERILPRYYRARRAHQSANRGSRVGSRRPIACLRRSLRRPESIRGHVRRGAEKAPAQGRGTRGRGSIVSSSVGACGTQIVKWNVFVIRRQSHQPNVWVPPSIFAKPRWPG